MEKIKVEICIGTSCHLLGAMDISLVLDDLAVELSEKLEITKRTCLDNCGHGPGLCINGKLYQGMTVDELRHIIKQLLKSGGADHE